MQKRSVRTESDLPDDPVRMLRQAGLTATGQRRAVYAALAAQERPASASAIHHLLNGDGLGIGLSTVYRTLHAFADAGIAHVFAGDELRYRICAPTPHTHLVCERCGLVIERPTDAVQHWLTPAGDPTDFIANIEHSDVYGACSRCR
jgi:Fur family ferric uptake transcriptional regulator